MASDPIRLAGGPTERAAGERVGELFREHGRVVYGLCRMLLRDPVEADDATQATFVSAFKALLGGGAVRDPAAWLAAIARNECRARAHARMREPLPLHDDDLAHGHGPHEEVNRRLAVEEIREAISELPDKQREAVVLRDLYGLRYDEVGAALGLSRASVEALLFRARRRLRVSLKPLASGALVVPVAVREGIAQALPGFGASAVGTGALAGGVTASAAGGGLLAKIVAAPVAAKLAAAAVAVGAAGSAGVVGAERAARHDPARTIAQPAPADVSMSVPDGLRRDSSGARARDDDRDRSAVSATGGDATEARAARDGDSARSSSSGERDANDDFESPNASKERGQAKDDEEHGARAGKSSEESSNGVKSKGEDATATVNGADRTQKSDEHEHETENGGGGSFDERDVEATTLEQPEAGEGGDVPEDDKAEEAESSGSSGGGDQPEDEPEETEPPA